VAIIASRNHIYFIKYHNFYLTLPYIHIILFTFYYYHSDQQKCPRRMWSHFEGHENGGIFKGP